VSSARPFARSYTLKVSSPVASGFAPHAADDHIAADPGLLGWRGQLPLPSPLLSRQTVALAGGPVEPGFSAESRRMARAFKRSRTSNTGLGVDSVIRHVDPGTAAGQPASECLNVLCATGPPTGAAFPRGRVSDLGADDLLCTDDPEADRQAGRAVGDLRPV
jgi:hypothetical protein